MKELTKVTDPAKITTDPEIIKELDRQGIDKDFVEFKHDYGKRDKTKGTSPYNKVYHDPVSNRHISMFSRLPKCRPDGTKLAPGWVYESGKYRPGTNLFDAEVSETRVTFAPLYDQPGGIKSSDVLTFQPQLFLDGVEVLPQSKTATLLASDPVNSNYQGNTLEWDYGICKRRLRVIEGLIKGYWVFAANPKGTIRIKYNQVGPFRLTLGQFKLASDLEVVTPQQFTDYAAQKGYPVAIGDSITVYPESGVTVDGYTGGWQSLGSGLLWNELVNHIGSHANYTIDQDWAFYIGADSNTNKFRNICRFAALFDTSAIPDDQTVLSATMGTYGFAKRNDLGVNVEAAVFSSNPASDSQLVAGDHDTYGSTQLSDSIAFASLSITEYSVFTLNASGLASISKTGNTKLAIREAAFDAPVVAPTWGNDLNVFWGINYTEKGAGYKPYLTVTYGVSILKINLVLGIWDE